MRRTTVVATALAIATTPLAVNAANAPATAAPEPAAIALTWQQTALATIYPAMPPPVGTLYLAFTSRAVHKAVKVSLRRHNSSETAAVAQAAHDVLVEYFSAAAVTLDAKLVESLAGVPDGAAENRGRRIGARAAARVIAARADDGRDDASIVYTKPDGIGVWQPDARGFTAPWLGFVDRILRGRPARVDGPDPVGSNAYRSDLAEVRALGRAGADADKAAVALFFSVNPVPMYRTALIAHLNAHPRSLLETTELFADLDAATAETARRAWRAKFKVGFWRPFEAIQTDDGDPLTPEDPTWTSVLPAPPYPENVSGHQGVTSAFTGVVACHLGDVPLTLVGATSSRSYATLELLRIDALNSRIWGGIHFRDALDDAYVVGSTYARRVCRH
jgi:hypothetical protein